jgi:predicted KAP-like P-loop ATPase
MSKPFKIVLAFLILILLKKKVESIVTTLLVRPIFSFIDSLTINDGIFIAFAIWMTFMSCSKVIKRVRVSASAFTLCSIVVLVYSYYRFLHSPWSFTSFELIPSLVYFDILYFISSPVIILFAAQSIIQLVQNVIEKMSKKNKIKPVSKLLEDNPWEHTKKDLFNREPAARRIADLIIGSTSIKSFAIGICAGWGDGKSSFLQMLKGRIPPDKENVIIEFNPWFSNNSDEIVKQFFDVFQAKLASYHLSLSRQIGHYSESLSSIRDNPIVSVGRDLSNFFESRASLEEERDKINNLLKQIKKRIIVFIDDLDRLDKREVIEILKMIRSSANFSNVFFIVAFDREYVKNAIKKINKHNVDLYLEKIFQIEIRPPGFDKVVIKQELVRLLIERFPKLEDAIRSAVYGRDNAIDALHAAFNSEIRSYNIVDYYLRNLRDVVRFVNLFIVNYSHVEGEVVFREFFYVQLILLKYPNAYHLIAKDSTRYLKLDGIGSGSSGLKYSLKGAIKL